MVLDGQGRVVIAFADGCLMTKGCTTKDGLRKGAIVKQVGGKGLYRMLDELRVTRSGRTSGRRGRLSGLTSRRPGSAP